MASVHPDSQEPSREKPCALWEHESQPPGKERPGGTQGSGVPPSPAGNRLLPSGDWIWWHWATSCSFTPIREASLVRPALGGHGKSPREKPSPVLPRAHFGEQVALGSALVAEASGPGVTLAFRAREKAAPSPLPAGSGSLCSTWRWLQQAPSSLHCCEGSFCSSCYF